MPVRLYENLRTVSYAPFYLSDVWGLYEDAGVVVETRLSPAPSETAEGLMAGRADVSFGGPMRVMLHHERDPLCPLVCFGQVVGPEPFALIGREPRPRFRFEDLVGLRVGVVTEVPTPWLTLQDDLRRAGLDPSSIDRADSRSMPGNVAALAAGELDVIQVMEPEAELALSDGGHLWHRFSTRGHIGFSTFYATRAFLDANLDACTRMVRAVKAATNRIYATGPEVLADALADYFPDLPRTRLASALARYQQADIWVRDAVLKPAEFVRLKGALLSGGFISRDLSFTDLIDNRPAEPRET